MAKTSNHLMGLARTVVDIDRWFPQSCSGPVGKRCVMREPDPAGGLTREIDRGR